ncbi:hypothetical protein PENTCL1PPCAC_24263, partial [Pristionchus entomophagus]
IAGVRPSEEEDDDSDKPVDFTLTCINQLGGKWKCETVIELVTFNTKRDRYEEKRLTFDNDNCVHALDWWYWPGLVNTKNGYIIKNKVVVEYTVKIICSEGIEPAPI